MSNSRTRSITWEDPVALAKSAVGLSGMEYLRKIVVGELPPPPIGVPMNFRIAELSEGHAVFVVEPAEYHYNPIGVSTGSSSSLTRVGSILGTPLYMSPEQCRGESLDARSDTRSPRSLLPCSTGKHVWQVGRR